MIDLINKIAHQEHLFDDRKNIVLWSGHLPKVTHEINEILPKKHKVDIENVDGGCMFGFKVTFLKKCPENVVYRCTDEILDYLKEIDN